MQNRIVSSLAMVAGLAGSARADVTAEVYSDVKGVIVELVTAEVATNIVPEIACRAGHIVEIVQPGNEVPPEVIKNGDKYYRLMALDHFSRTLHAVYGRQFGGLKSAMVSEVADLAAYQVFLALRDTESFKSLGEIKMLQGSNALDYIATGKAAGIRESEEIRKNVFGALPNPDTCRTDVRALFAGGTFGVPHRTRLESRCDRPSNNEKVACDLARGIRAMLLSQPNAAERHVTRAAARVIAGAIRTRLDPQMNEGMVASLEAKLDVIIAALAEGNIVADVLPWLAAELAPITVTFNDLTPRAQQLAAEVARVTQKLSTLEQPFRWAMTEWRSIASGEGRLDVSSFVERLLATKGAMHTICELAPQDPVCLQIGNVARVLAPEGLLWPLVQAASRGDARAVAQAVIGSIFSAIRDDAACKEVTKSVCQQDVYQRFATALALYVIDAAESGATAETTRAAFRSAAIEVIRSVNPRGYTRSWIYNIPYPDFALRFSWNGGYVDDEGSSFRYVASMPFISFRPPIWYSERAYAAVHVSLLDPLAPLSELALRPNNIDFSENREVAWNVFAPRVDVVVGIPSLSSHLTVGLGASLRLAVPYDVTQAGATVRSFVYRPLWDKDTSWSRSIEVGFSVKYML